MRQSQNAKVMNRTIDLKPEHRAIVQTVLRAHLPQQARVWVFGSRATGKARQGSDLDLAIDTGQKLPPALQSTLHFAFEDSDLPWTVDMVDMQDLQDGIFRQNVERDKVALDWREGEDGQ